MFYCDECAKEHGWKTSFLRSRGVCEVCSRVRSCSDVHHSVLFQRELAEKEMAEAQRELDRAKPKNCAVLFLVNGRSPELQEITPEQARELAQQAQEKVDAFKARYNLEE